MKLLALETSGLGASVAAAEDERLLTQRQLAPEQRSAKELAPLVERVLQEVGWRPSDIELIGVTIGPGSFTGLRVGVTTAKTLAFALECPLVGVNTLLALSGSLPNEFSNGWSILDAQRGELFAQSWRREKSSVVPTSEVEVLSVDAWLAKLLPGESLVGPVLPRVVERLPQSIIVAPEQYWQPQASSVANLARAAFLAGHIDDPIALVPQYHRRTAAEEQWEKLGRK